MVKILLADDHRMIREGLAALLEAEADLKVVGEAEDGRTAVRLIGELAPDVVVMDLRMPDMNGVEATRHALAAKADTESHRPVGFRGASTRRRNAEGGRQRLCAERLGFRGIGQRHPHRYPE